MTASSLAEYLADADTDLPEAISTEEAVIAVTALHEQNGGATFSLYFGDLADQELYAVSPFPERTLKLPGRRMRRQALLVFLNKNADLLRDPRNSLGCWYNEANQATYLDVTTTLPSRRQVVGLALRYNQIAFYDLKRAEPVEAGGTGEEVANLPPEAERLPAIVRGTKP